MSENNTDTSKNQTTETSKKKKGPIRFEAIVPFLIFCILMSLYYIFFFDSHLRKTIELAGSLAYGAEINISDLDTSVKTAQLSIQGIQITDIDHVEKNLIEIEEIHLQLNWDALLKARLVVTDSAIKNIRLDSERKSPGKIYRSKNKTKKSIDSAQKQLLKNTQQKFQGNVFGDAAGLLDGGDPASKLGDIKNDLLTKKKIDAIQGSLQGKEAEWDGRFKKLPNKSEFESIIKQLKALKFDSKKPKELAGSIKTGGKLLKEADTNIKQIRSETELLEKDIKAVKGQIGELESIRQQDIAALQSRIQIPELDTKTIAQVIFGSQIQEYQQKFGKYIEMGREYLPEKSEKDGEKKEEVVSPKTRSPGRTIEFPTTKSYPMVWIQKAHISSKEDNSSLSGNLSGDITDITSNPKLLKKPTVIKLAGDFPGKNISGITADISLDHTGDIPTESFVASVKSYPVPRKDFSKSKDVQFGFSKATGAVNLNGNLTGRNLQMNIKNSFQKISYFVDAKSQSMKDALSQVSRDVPVIQVDASLSGYWREPKIKIKSNLARAIEKSLKKQLQAKINAAKKKLENLVNDQIAGQKKKLNEDFKKMTSKYTGQLNDLKKQAEGTKKQAQAELNKSKSSAKTKGVEDRAKKELGKALKKLKF